MKDCKSHADRLGVPTGVTGETVQKVLIAEENRVSAFVPEYDVSEIKALLDTRHRGFRRNNIPAVVFGLDQPDGNRLYALYADQKGTNGAAINPKI